MAGYKFCGMENSERTTHRRDGERIKTCQKIAVDTEIDGYFIRHVRNAVCFLSKVVRW